MGLGSRLLPRNSGGEVHKYEIFPQVPVKAKVLANWLIRCQDMNVLKVPTSSV